MSRIGKQPIAVPSGVEVKLDATGRNIDIKGAQGNLTFHWRPEIEVTLGEEDKQICCAISSDADDTRQNSAFWGTTRARINKGYTKKLKIVGVGWNAKAQGQTIVLNIGFCHPVPLEAPAGVKFDVENNVNITITGADKQAVGQFAANIRSKREPEPYNGKGIMYHDEVIIRKAGKAFGA
jgi:large subunit ribosomal protein L6